MYAFLGRHQIYQFEQKRKLEHITWNKSENNRITSTQKNIHKTEERKNLLHLVLFSVHSSVICFSVFRFMHVNWATQSNQHNPPTAKNRTSKSEKEKEKNTMVTASKVHKHFVSVEINWETRITIGIGHLSVDKLMVKDEYGRWTQMDTELNSRTDQHTWTHKHTHTQETERRKTNSLIQTCVQTWNSIMNYFMNIYFI